MEEEAGWDGDPDAKINTETGSDKGESWGAGSFSRNPSYSWLDSMSFGMLLRVWPGEWGH